MKPTVKHVPIRFIRNASVVTIAVCLIFLGGVALFNHTPQAHAAATITVNGSTTFQTIDGFGVSGAFGPALSLEQLDTTDQTNILNMLFSTSTGAGFSILRNNLPSDPANTIEPNAPAGPNATPTYTWDGSSQGQVWLAKQAESYGVKNIYLNAWSAPGFMKTNGSEANGGTLCGVPGASCSSGDWRQAYANYLVQYIKDYESAGITPTEIGFENEPELTTSYSSMIMSAAQSADFIKVLAPTLKSAGLPQQITCCDAEGWGDAINYTSGIAGDATAFADTSIFTGHGYTGAPTTSLFAAGTKHAWESEWSTFDSWDPSWDSGSDASGFTWANNIYTGLTSANLSAFFYWAGVWFNSSDNGMLIHDNNGTIAASKRVSAFANYSRFIRPGAVRIGATSTDGNLKLVAAKNTDGSYDVVVLNANSSDTPATFALQNMVSTGTATPYLTNSANDVSQQGNIGINGNSFAATVPARSLVTYRITGSNGGPTPTATATSISNQTPTPTPTPTVSSATPTPTPTQTSSGNGVTATGVVASSSPWFSEEDIKFSGTSTITAMTATITVQKTAGVSYSGSYVTFGGATLGHTDNGSTITYTFTLNSGQTLPSGQSLLDAAQFGGNGTVHPTSGDLWSITTTSNGVTSTQSGHF